MCIRDRDTSNNLSDLVFQCVRAVGVIVAGYGIVQIGLAVQSHDSCLLYTSRCV